MSQTVSIHIVTWNSMKFIPDLLASIDKLTYRDFQVLIIDNGSSDEIESFVKEKHPSVRFIRNVRNLGFCDAHNQGIRYALEHWGGEDLSQKFILITNPDIIFTDSYLETLLYSVKEKPEYGSFGGKLLRAYGDGISDEIMKETIHSDRIDSTGIRFHKNYTFTDRGAGELDTGQFDVSEDVFGISGALVLYRASALESVRYQDEFFDHDFFAYKEDVDLAFRLQCAGWRAWYEPKAVAYHYREMFGQEKMSLWQRMKNRKTKSRVRSYYSTRNHWLFLQKNMDVVSALVCLPRLVVSEVLRFLYLCLFEQKNMKAVFEAIKLFSRMQKKHRAVASATVFRGRTIRKKFAV